MMDHGSVPSDTTVAQLQRMSITVAETSEMEEGRKERKKEKKRKPLVYSPRC